MTTTPHDVTYYPIVDLYIKTPEETADRVLDEVEDAQASYKRGAQSSYEQYRTLTSGAAQDFTPMISGFSPASKIINSGAATITITGTYFTATSQVNWGGSPIATTFVNATTLTISRTAPATVQAVSFFVVNGDLSSNTKNFPYTAALREAPTNTWRKADIVAWLQEQGVDLDEDALNSLTKTELLELVADLTDDETEE